MRTNAVRNTIIGCVAVAAAVVLTIPVFSQSREGARTVAVRAARLFDAKSGQIVTNQVVLISGDRITDVGSADRVRVPAGTTVIDLGSATVLPGLIDGHVHVMGSEAPAGDAGLQHQMLVGLVNAQRNLEAGFTSVVDLGSHGGGFGTVQLRKGIESGLVQGPRMLVSGPTVMVPKRASAPYPPTYTIRPDTVIIDGPEKTRAAMRQLRENGADVVKLMNDFTSYTFKPTGEMVNQTFMTLDEIKAAVDEAHRLGMKVASHTYGDDGLRYAIEAGVDNIQHAVDAVDVDIKKIIQKGLVVTPTLLDMVEDEPKDVKRFGEYTRIRLMEQTWKRLYAAGVKMGFGSGAAAERIYDEACKCSHGAQARQFALYVKWGAPAAYALRLATSVNADIWGLTSVGTIEKGKFADIIAVAGDPLGDITEMQRVRFVMKGGKIVRNDLKAERTISSR